MNKYVNCLLFGFLLFIIGLIIVNFDLKNYNYVNYLPSEFENKTEVITLSIDKNKTYSVMKAKYNQNIIIEKEINESIEDNVVMFEVNHTKTSETFNTLKTDKNKVSIIFSNNFSVTSKNDLIKIYKLFVKCIKDKTIYNYNLLKYSKIVIKGNSKSLDRIKIEKYGI